MFFALALIAACSACTEPIDLPQDSDKEPDPDVGPTPENVQLEAVILDHLDTKTVASDNGDVFSVTWTGFETVSVNGKESSSIEVDASNAKRAVFAFDEVSAPYASVYPAVACKSVSGTTGTVFLPSEQKYVSGSFDSDAALMVGYSEQEGKIEFHHAVSRATLDKMPFSIYNMRLFSPACRPARQEYWYTHEKKRQETCSRSIT